MKIRPVEVWYGGEPIVHAADQDSAERGVLCGAVESFDWRHDRFLGTGTREDWTLIECERCVEIAVRRMAEERA